MQQSPVQTSPKQLPLIPKSYYQSLGQVKMSFKVLQDFVKQLNNYNLILPAETKLIEVKQKIDQLSKKNFVFYLKDSFMPSLDCRIGDLAQCYGRYDDREKVYQMNFTVCSVKDFFG